MTKTKKKSERGTLNYYLELNYPVTLYQDSDGGFVAEIKDLPGCITQAESSEEALAEIEDARILWIETAYEHEDFIPLPSTETKYSGRVLLRMPRSLHQKLVEEADKEGVSLNQHIVSLLSNKAGLVIDIKKLKGEVETLKLLSAEVIMSSLRSQSPTHEVLKKFKLNQPDLPIILRESKHMSSKI